MRKVVFVIGTRAEAIKILPIAKELERRRLHYSVISTGQHDLREFRFRNFKELNPPTGTSGTFRSSLGGLQFSVANVFKLVPLLRGSIVIVQGDTMTTAAGAVAGRLAGATVCHVESGLRTGDLMQPYPEEASRVIADKFSNLHFAPTKRAARATRTHSTYLVGNTVIDSIRARKLKVSDKDFVIFSIHRQENIKDAEVLAKLAAMVEKTAMKRRIKFVLSQNTKARLGKAGLLGKIEENCEILPVLPYEKFLPLLASCTAVVSDSGGLAEECAFLKKPLVIFRKKTERMESVEHGYAFLGFDADLEKFVKNFRPRGKNIYGDGTAAKKIVDVLERLES